MLTIHRIVLYGVRMIIKKVEPRAVVRSRERIKCGDGRTARREHKNSCLELAACTMIGIADSGRVVVVVAVALTFYVTVITLA